MPSMNADMNWVYIAIAFMQLYRVCFGKHIAEFSVREEKQ